MCVLLQRSAAGWQANSELAGVETRAGGGWADVAGRMAGLHKSGRVGGRLGGPGRAWGRCRARARFRSVVTVSPGYHIQRDQAPGRHSERHRRSPELVADFSWQHTHLPASGQAPAEHAVCGLHGSGTSRKAAQAFGHHGLLLRSRQRGRFDASARRSQPAIPLHAPSAGGSFSGSVPYGHRSRKGRIAAQATRQHAIDRATRRQHCEQPGDRNRQLPACDITPGT